MSAESSPSPAPDNKHEDLITRFIRQHAEAMIDVQQAVDHTATEGWQKVYGSMLAEDRKFRRDGAKQLRIYAEMYEDLGLSDEAVKSAKKILAAADEHRVQMETFERQVVEKVSAPVRSLERLIIEAKNAAARDESAAPLVNVGLEHAMRIAIADRPTARFDRERGIVSIIPPEGNEDKPARNRK